MGPFNVMHRCLPQAPPQFSHYHNTQTVKACMNIMTVFRDTTSPSNKNRESLPDSILEITTEQNIWAKELTYNVTQGM